jgi:hypothetical protein
MARESGNFAREAPRHYFDGLGNAHHGRPSKSISLFFYHFADLVRMA